MGCDVPLSKGRTREFEVWASLCDGEKMEGVCQDSGEEQRIFVYREGGSKHRAADGVKDCHGQG